MECWVEVVIGPAGSCIHSCSFMVDLGLRVWAGDEADHWGFQLTTLYQYQDTGLACICVTSSTSKFALCIWISVLEIDR